MQHTAVAVHWITAVHLSRNIMESKIYGCQEGDGDDEGQVFTGLLTFFSVK